MAKKEVKTDLWVASQLTENGIHFTPQGSDIKEISKALSKASKNGTGRPGYPEYTALVKDFLIVIEDKASTDDHVYFTDSGLINIETQYVKKGAVNGAYYYSKFIAQNSVYKKVLSQRVRRN